MNGSGRAAIKRAAIYARYSSDRQSVTSIDDQVRLCRERIVAEGGELVEVYFDAAISGASTLNRPRLQQLLADAKEKRFDVVVTEALDRISRGQADVARIFELLRFVDVSIFTLSEGAISELHVGLKGTMNALYIKDLGEKVHRGQRGRVEAGRVPAGLGYGYRVTESRERGLRTIDPDEEKIVLRIFYEYVNGRSPRSIAKGLNDDGIPSPSGGKWTASTINGSRKRGIGILNNAAYNGLLVWNRERFVKDPESGKRLARTNPKEEWHIVEAEELRIVPPALWLAKEAMQEKLEHAQLPHTKRPKRLLSGLLCCHLCGGAMTICGTARYGCSAHRESGTCSNNRTLSARKVEGRVIEGLRKELLHPKAIGAAMKAYHKALREQNKAAEERRHAADRELARIKKQLAAIIEAVKNGLYHPDMNEETKRLQQRKAELEAAMGEKSAVIDLHPGALLAYEARIAELLHALNQDEERRLRAHQVLRHLVDRVTIVHGEERGEFSVQIEGRLAAILTLAQGQDQDLKKISMGTVVAGAGFEPATFRL